MPGSGESEQNQLGFLKNYIKSLLKAISVRIKNVALKIHCFDHQENLLTRDASPQEFENYPGIKKEYPFSYPTPVHPSAIFVLAETEKFKLEAKIY